MSQKQYITHINRNKVELEAVSDNLWSPAEINMHLTDGIRINIQWFSLVAFGNVDNVEKRTAISWHSMISSIRLEFGVTNRFAPKVVADDIRRTCNYQINWN